VIIRHADVFATNPVAYQLTEFVPSVFV